MNGSVVKWTETKLYSYKYWDFISWKEIKNFYFMKENEMRNQGMKWNEKTEEEIDWN